MSNEIALLNKDIKRFKGVVANLSKENKQLKEELNRYKEMEVKGLEEFKDVGGCWGCGLQLQLEQNIKDLKKYGQENEKLKEALVKIKSFFNPEYNDYQTNLIKKMMKDIIEEVLKDE